MSHCAVCEIELTDSEASGDICGVELDTFVNMDPGCFRPVCSKHPLKECVKCNETFCEKCLKDGICRPCRRRRNHERIFEKDSLDLQACLDSAIALLDAAVTERALLDCATSLQDRVHAAEYVDPVEVEECKAYDSDFEDEQDATERDMFTMFKDQLYEYAAKNDRLDIARVLRGAPGESPLHVEVHSDELVWAVSWPFSPTLDFLLGLQRPRQNSACVQRLLNHFLVMQLMNPVRALLKKFSLELEADDIKYIDVRIPSFALELIESGVCPEDILVRASHYQDGFNELVKVLTEDNWLALPALLEAIRLRNVDFFFMLRTQGVPCTAQCLDALCSTLGRGDTQDDVRLLQEVLSCRVPADRPIDVVPPIKNYLFKEHAFCEAIVKFVPPTSALSLFVADDTYCPNAPLLHALLDTFPEVVKANPDTFRHLICELVTEADANAGDQLDVNYFELPEAFLKKYAEITGGNHLSAAIPYELLRGLSGDGFRWCLRTDPRLLILNDEQKISIWKKILADNFGPAKACRRFLKAFRFTEEDIFGHTKHERPYVEDFTGGYTPK
jgi:hypothetical protein